MKCPECDNNGINPFAKMSLMFVVAIRCKCCGTTFVLNTGLSAFVQLTLYVVILFVVVYAFGSLNQLLVYFGAVFGLLLIGFVILSFPLKVKSKIGGRLKSKRRKPNG